MVKKLSGKWYKGSSIYMDNYFKFTKTKCKMYDKKTKKVVSSDKISKVRTVSKKKRIYAVVLKTQNGSYEYRFYLKKNGKLKKYNLDEWWKESDGWHYSGGGSLSKESWD